MGWESFGVVKFDLGPLLQMRIAKPKSAYNSLALVSCLFGGYTFASVLRYVGLVNFCQ